MNLITVCTVSGATHREAPHPLSNAMQCRFPVLSIYLARADAVSTKTDQLAARPQSFISYPGAPLSLSFPQAVEKRVRHAALI